MWSLQSILLLLVAGPSLIRGGSYTNTNNNNNNYDYVEGGAGGGGSNYGRPPQNPIGCYREGFHPGSDCTKFIRCVSNGVGFTKYDFDCGPGTVFDENLSLCNHPYMLSPKSPCYRTIGGQATAGGYGAGTGQRSKSSQLQGQNGVPPAAPGDRNLGRVGGRQLSDRGSSSQQQPQAQYQRPPVFSVSTSRSSVSIQSRVSSKSSPAVSSGGSSSEENNGREQFQPDWSARTRSEKMKGGKSANFESDNSPRIEDDVVPQFDTNEANDTTVWLDILECPEAGFFPHPTNCSKFYRCLDYFNDGQNFTYVVFQFDCPAGQFFDELVYGCNLAENVSRPECQLGNNNSTTTLTQEQIDMDSSPMCPVLISMPSTQDENLDHVQIFVSPILTPPRAEPADVNVNGTEEPTMTSPRTWSRTTLPSSATESTSTTTTPPTPASDQLLACTSGPTSGSVVIRANPFDCNKFYSCSWTGDAFVIKVRQCPIGQIFVEESQKCEDEATAPPCNSNLSEQFPSDDNGQNSTNSTTTAEATMSTTAEPITELINADNSCPSEGNFGIPDDCFRFYYCRRTGFILTALLMKCPENYHFSHGLCRKNLRLPVTCSQKPTKKTSKEVKSSTNVEEDDEDEGIWGNVGVPVPRQLSHLFIEQ